MNNIFLLIPYELFHDLTSLEDLRNMGVICHEYTKITSAVHARGVLLEVISIPK